MYRQRGVDVAASVDVDECVRLRVEAARHHFVADCLLGLR